MFATAEDLKAHRRPYQPYGAAEDLLYCRDPQVLLSGPAGTGKSRACLEKLFICARKYPGMRGLIVRKTRESLTETALVTWEEKVVPPGQLRVGELLRSNRQSYELSNKSVVVVGGMDKPGKVMSAEYDQVYIQEATDLAERDLEVLTTRLRNGVMPYQQVIMDCNPDKPTHWLKKRCDAGITKMIESRHEDNPVYWDRANECWTPAGVDYIAKLDALTGSLKPRLRYGRWVQSEGVVYEGWDAQKHIIDRFTIPDSWPRYWAIDFGYTNPFVCHWYAEDPDGRLYLYREIYFSKRLVEEHAAQIQALSAEEPRPQAVICDHDAEGRATLEKHLNIETTPANKKVEIAEGCQALSSRLKTAEDGRPRFFVLRDSLVERDPVLLENKKPVGFVEEVDGYIWNVASGRRKGEDPVKENDHACDAARYLCVHKDVGERKREFEFW
jgi:PBSX family phage terminase large subunit